MIARMRKNGLMEWVLREPTGDYECSGCKKVVCRWERTRYCPDCGRRWLKKGEEKHGNAKQTAGQRGKTGIFNGGGA